MTASPFALVFGGSGDLGCATAQVLQREGMQVMATCRQQNHCEAMQVRIGAGTLAQACKITEPESLAAVIDHLRVQTKQLDAMVYAIGCFDDISEQQQYVALDEIDADRIDKMIAVHTRGAILACRAVLDLMRPQGGNIVLLGALNGSKPVRSPVHFAAAKSALLGVAQSLAKELGQWNIRINLLVPGIVNGRHLYQVPEAQRALFLKHSTRQRFAEVGEIAEVAGWFAQHNTYVTGQAIMLDGGV
jgi:NAD(P)-dependent dehydrogenase (short-subunit alcohol dehydrogenase family)